MVMVRPGGQRVREVGSDRASRITRLLERVSPFDRLRGHLRHSVRHHFEALQAAGELQAAQFSELRHQPGARRRDRPRG